MQYCAVIGDIIGSRRLKKEERAKVQARLRYVLEEINETYRFEIAAQFLITLGDEFQGLLYFAGPAMEITQRIARAMYPAKLRYGVGIGEISTGIDPDKALGADGPAYHRARDCVNALRARKTQGFPVLVRTGGAEDSLLDGLCLLLDGLVSGWSSKQAECVRSMRVLGEQLVVAERLGLTPSTVSRTLARAQYEKYETALDRLNAYFAAVDDSREDTPLRQARRVQEQSMQLAAARDWERAAGTLRAFLQKPVLAELPARQRMVLLRRLANVQLQNGHMADAAGAVQEGLRIARREHSQEAEAAMLNDLAAVYLQQGNLTEAAEALDGAERLVKACSLPDSLGYAVRGRRADLYERAGQREKALAACRAVLREMPEPDENSVFLPGDTVLNLGDLLFRMGNIQEGRACAVSALAGFQEIGRFDMAGRAARLLQRMEAQNGDPARAASYARIARLAEKREKQMAQARETDRDNGEG